MALILPLDGILATEPTYSPSIKIILLSPSIISGIYLVRQKIFSITILIKFLCIVYIRQIVEDYCLDLPLFIAFIGHPLWHILASKFSVQLADELYNYLHISNKYSYNHVPV